MALIAVAESAQDIASGFNKFLDPVPEFSTEITGLISECYAISSALRELNTAKDDQRYYREYDLIYPDVTFVKQSLEYTFHDVRRLFGGLGRPTHLSNRIAYFQVWEEIGDHFYWESNSSLLKRLEYNRLFLTELSCILIAGRPSDDYTFPDLQERTVELLRKQESRLESALNNLSLGDPGAANRQRSFERRRPPGLFTQVPDPPPMMRGGGRRQGPISPQSPPGFDDYYPWAPPAPDVPTSPTTTTTFSTQSSIDDSSRDHWLPRMFEQSRPTTPFRQTGEVSTAYGPDMPGASAKLNSEFEKLLD
ncbi:MAG: hypothetical protein Q9183_006460, partial [Haloplaca sp. 2 TL-2023]